MTFKTQKGTELPLSDLRGKDYLEVKWRILWFREEHPTWAIETELIESSDKHAVAKGTIRTEDGRIVATGHKYENVNGFKDFREKAETGAIGRALAHIGYGTQFAVDLDEGERLADAPIPRPQVKPTLQVAKTNSEFADEIFSIPNSIPSREISEYVIKFGKFKTQTLSQVKPRDLLNYCEYLETTAEKEGKPMGNMAQELVEKVRKYVSEGG